MKKAPRHCERSAAISVVWRQDLKIQKLRAAIMRLLRYARNAWQGKSSPILQGKPGSGRLFRFVALPTLFLFDPIQLRLHFIF